MSRYGDNKTAALSSKTSLKTLYFHIISIKFNADKGFFFLQEFQKMKCTDW